MRDFQQASETEILLVRFSAGPALTALMRETDTSRQEDSQPIGTSSETIVRSVACGTSGTRPPYTQWQFAHARQEIAAAGSLPSSLPHGGFCPSLQFLGRHVLLVCGYPPIVARRVLHTCAAVSIELVGRFHQRV